MKKKKTWEEQAAPKMRYYPWHAILSGRKMDVGIKKKKMDQKDYIWKERERENFKTFSILD